MAPAWPLGRLFVASDWWSLRVLPSHWLPQRLPQVKLEESELLIEQLELKLSKALPSEQFTPRPRSGNTTARLYGAEVGEWMAASVHSTVEDFVAAQVGFSSKPHHFTSKPCRFTSKPCRFTSKPSSFHLKTPSFHPCPLSPKTKIARTIGNESTKNSGRSIPLRSPKI